MLIPGIEIQAWPTTGSPAAAFYLATPDRQPLHPDGRLLMDKPTALQALTRHGFTARSAASVIDVAESYRNRFSARPEDFA